MAGLIRMMYMTVTKNTRSLAESRPSLEHADLYEPAESLLRYWLTFVIGQSYARPTSATALDSPKSAAGVSACTATTPRK